jgi:hypothetical protein
MRETSDDYLFQSLTHSCPVAFTKNNYAKHIPRHPYIAGKDGLARIEEALLNPSVITRYTQSPHIPKAKRRCQAFYKILKRRDIGGGKFLLDYWQVIMIENKAHRRWEIATVLAGEDSPEYAMINTKIETILHDYR